MHLIMAMTEADNHSVWRDTIDNERCAQQKNIPDLKCLVNPDGRGATTVLCKCRTIISALSQRVIPFHLDEGLLSDPSEYC